MKQILKNLFSLSLSELFTKIVALITSAYIARILNPEGFGIINFTTAFVSYFVLTAAFGLDTYGNREVARETKEKETIVDNIFSLKLFLSLIVFVVYVLIVVISNNSVLVRTVLLITGVNIIISAVNMNWYFQAVERMNYVAARQIFTSLFILCGMFLFVHSSEDVVIAAGISIIAGGLNSLLFISAYQKLAKKIKIVFNAPIWRKILKESSPLLFSSLLIAIYYNLDMVMLGYMKSQNEVGVYSAAYKIFLVGIIPLTLILNSFFPSLSRTELKKSIEFNTLIKNYFMFLFFTGLISASVLFLFRDSLIQFVFGEGYKNAALPLSILAMNALVISINIFFGNPLIAWGKQKEYSIAIMLGAITNIILNIILIPSYSYNGAAFATLLSESVVFCGVLFLFTKHTKNIL